MRKNDTASRATTEASPTAKLKKRTRANARRLRQTPIAKTKMRNQTKPNPGGKWEAGSAILYIAGAPSQRAL